MGTVRAIFGKVQSLFTLTDEQAMGRVRLDNDPHAFAVLVERHEAKIQALCTRMLGDPHRGEDLAQETFIRIHLSRNGYQPSAKFSTYLWRIALNLCYSELRRRKRHGEVSIEMEGESGFSLLDGHADPHPHPAEDADGMERAGMVRSAILELPEIYRSVVVLRHYQDLKFREIADVLEIPVGTVKSRMAEAIGMLSNKLKPALADHQPDTAVLFPKTKQPEALLL